MLRTLAGRRSVLILGAVMLLALAIAGAYLTTDGRSQVEASTGGPEMVLNIKGGDCDDAVRPAECDVALGTQFTLSVDALGIPTDGYVLFSTFIHFGDQLVYAPSASAADEIVWPDCDSATTLREQVDFSLADPWASDYTVWHSCLTSGLIPLPASFFTGNLVEIDLTCSIGDTSSLIQLLPRVHPITATSGSHFFAIGENGGKVDPKLSSLLLNCGAGGPLPTPTFTPTSPPTSTPQPTPTGPTPTPTATLPAPAKGNDDFADPFVITGPLPFGNVDNIRHASKEANEPEPCAELARTVWYTYTPPADTFLLADTIGSFGDPALAVYTGTSLATLVNIKCDDNGGPGSDAEVSFNAIGGTTYYFQVAHVPGPSSTTLAFNLHASPPKGNDDFAGSIAAVGPLPYSNKEDAGGATLEPGEQRPCASVDNTIWYSFTPTLNVVLAASTDGSFYDTAIAVYTGNTLNSLAVLGCDDDAGFGRNSRLTFNAQAGVTYHFQVGGALEARGNAVFNLSAEVAPAKGNDDFANALDIGQPFPFSNKEDTAGATLEVGEPQGCGPTAGTIWYSLTPDTDVIIRGDTDGSGAESPRLAVYTGETLETLTLLDCGARFIVATVGETYYFQLGGCVFSGCSSSFGSLQINLPDYPCSTLGCPEFGLRIPGGDCDDPSRPTKCNVPLGEKFDLAVEILAAPVEGYIIAQSFIKFGFDLVYDRDAATLSDEMRWPDCVIGVRGQLGDDLVHHGCITGLFPPVPASHYVGTFVQLSLTCSSAPSSTETLLLPHGDPMTVTSGTAFLEATDDILVVPKISNLTINCVAPPTPTPPPTPPPFPKMSKLPALQNVWLTRQGDEIPPADCLAGTDIGSLTEVLSQAIDSPDPKEPGSVQQLAAFEFEVHYDNTKVCVDLTVGDAFVAAGATCVVEDDEPDSKPQFEGVARVGCVTVGKGHDIDELVPLAQIDVYPQAELYSQIKPNQDNGVVVQIINVNCGVGDEQGHAISVFSCDDADITFRYLEGDVNPDCVVNAADAQTIAFRWGVSKGSLIYNDFLNLEPSGAQADDDIDINDLQFVFGRIGSACGDPHPLQPPVNPKA